MISYWWKAPHFDLGTFKHVYVVGGGKAGGKMAQAIEKFWANMSPLES